MYGTIQLLGVMFALTLQFESGDTALDLPAFLCASNERTSMAQTVDSARLGAALMNGCMNILVMKYKFNLTVMRTIVEVSCVLFRVTYGPTRVKTHPTGKALQQLLTKNFNNLVNFYAARVHTMKLTEETKIEPNELVRYMRDFEECFLTTLKENGGWPSSDAVVIKTNHWLLQNVFW